MNEASKLQKFEEYARVLRESCQPFTEGPGPELPAGLREVLDRIARMAAETEELARSPVKIGVVGEFSSGKTLLLGSLIGYADGLPVSELPTTGNVRSLHFTLHDDLTTTEVGPFTIEYLDHAGVEDCLTYMLQETALRAATAQLRAALQQQLVRFNVSDPATLPALERWCSEAWSATSNPNLRYLLRDLVTFIRAYARCGTGMCSGPLQCTLEAGRARQGLELAEPPRDIQGLTFADLPPAPRPISVPPDPAALTAQDIRATFPLIRRVRVAVRLSKHIWDFSALTGANQFVLLDFPGLGAANSGVRDMYLCLRELAEVQTILIVLNGDKPGGNEGAVLYDMMQKNRPSEDLRDAILVGVGRFDRLPLGNEGLDKLRRLCGPAQAPVNVTEQTTLEELPILKACVACAEALTPHHRKDRIVLLSPLLHLKLLADNQPRIQVGSPEFVGHLHQDAQRAVECRRLWQVLADRLEKSTPGSRGGAGLTRWLDDFGNDGGISRLRELIQSHVQTHGLTQLYEAVLKKAEALRNEQKCLRDQVLPPQAEKDRRTHEDRLEAARKKFGRLAEFYQDVTQKIKQGPPLQVQRDGRPATVNEVTQGEVVFRIFEWGQWDTLLQARRNGYIVEEGVREGSFEDEGEDGGEDGGEEVFPTRSEDFYPSFEQTVQLLAEFSRQQVAAGVDYWLSQRAAEVAAERQEFDGPLQNPQLPKRIRALRVGPRGQGLVAALRAAIDPVRLKALIFPDGDPAKLEIPTKPNPNALFPLARAPKGDAKLGRTFAWNRKLQEGPEEHRPDRNFTHQSQVLRLRDEFVTAVSQEMAQTVSVATQAINEKILGLLIELNARLALVASNDVVLDTLLQNGSAGDNAGKPAEDPLAPVRQLAALEPHF